MDWINLKKAPPKENKQYLVHCTGINVPYVYQIAYWDGLYFWSVPGNMQYPTVVNSGDKVTFSASVDYYFIITSPPA